MKSIEFSLHDETAKKSFCRRIMSLDTKLHPDWVAKVFEDKSEKGRMRRGLHGVWLPYISKHYHETHGIKFSSKVWKELFKELFLWDVTIEMPNGKIKKRTVSSEDLTRNEYREWMDNINMYCAIELQLQLPEMDPRNRIIK